ncbi:hypothetical protein [Actinomadura atramentaria]|uniref:hypothetical protein n=1 Tax=Actinomadura atramentaria TaxID=1990 RepID=UPI00037EC5B7|nr:hypothetical protein [Actinomadura atramentaria]
MSVILIGIVPDNPGGACPAVFRAEEPGGGYYFQGKTVESGGGLEHEALVWLPVSMTTIIRDACRVHPVPADGGTERGAIVRAFDPWDGFYVRGSVVSDPALLAKIAAESPILDDELVVWLPEDATAEIMEACDARGVV